MKRNPFRLGAHIAACIWLFVAGCSNVEPAAESTVAVEEATVVAATVAPVAEPESNLAIVDSAEIVLSDAVPVDVLLIARGNLADGCTQIDGRSQSRSGSAFSIELTTSRDADLVCTQSLVPFEEQIELDAAGLEAGTYTVTTNGVVQTFVLAADNIAAQPAPTMEPTPVPTEPPAEPSVQASALFTVTGLVFHDLCAVADITAPTNVPAASDGCVETENGGFQANGLLEDDEPPLVGIKMNLGKGACPASDAVISAETNDLGQYAFANVPAGDYCLFSQAAAEPNASALIPGRWTTPNEIASIDLTIEADTEAVPFGWDYQFLPVPEAQIEAAPVRPGCIDLFAFDGDVTVPDDTPFEPGAPIRKTWRLINTGSCTWTDGYELIYLRGDKLGAPDSVVMPDTVVPGESVDITVEMTAPTVLGTYRGDWIMRSSFGQIFGIGGSPEDPIWLQIEVVEPDTVGGIEGLIWLDGCDQSAYTFGDPALPDGCLQNANGTIRGDGLYDRDNEAPFQGVTIFLGSGECGNAEFVRAQVSAEDGSYAFPNLLAGAYCIYIELLTDANYGLMIPGNFTVPAPGRSGITVTLAPNAEFENINFAWDPLED